MERAPQSANESDRYHLAVSAPGGTTPDAVRRIGAIVGLTAYDVRLRIAGAVPRPLKTFDEAGEAIRAGTELGALGIRSAVFAESRMPPVEPFPVRRWEWRGTDLCVFDRRDRRAVIARADLGFVAFGVRVTARSESQLETDYRIGYRGSTQTTHRLVKKRQTELPLFALLIPREHDRPASQFVASALDFSGLPGRREPSDNGNMRRLHALMEQAWADAPIDRTMLANRVDSEHHLFFNRRTCEDATVAVAYLLWYLRLADSAAGGVYCAAG